MRLYLTKLAQQLDFDRPGWRKDTVLLLDGALYHLSTDIKNHLGVLEFPVIYTGPRSYDAAPCELLFA